MSDNAAETGNHQADAMPRFRKPNLTSAAGLLCHSTLALIVVTLFEPSASGQYRFDSWMSDSGLPQNSVYSIAQTPDGYLWFTTLDGLVRYDGVRFTVFNRGNTEGLIGNRFIKLFVDTDGALWAGTADGIVTRMKEGRFSSFVATEGTLFFDGCSFQQGPGSNVSISTSRGLFEWKGSAFAKDPVSDSIGRESRVYFGPSGTRWSLDQTSRHAQQHSFNYFSVRKICSSPAPPAMFRVTAKVRCSAARRRRPQPRIAMRSSTSPFQ